MITLVADMFRESPSIYDLIAVYNAPLDLDQSCRLFALAVHRSSTRKPAVSSMDGWIISWAMSSSSSSSSKENRESARGWVPIAVGQPGR